MRSSDLMAAGMLFALAGAVCARVPADEQPKPPDPEAASTPASPPPAPAPPAPAGKPVELASSDLGGLNALLPVGKTARKVVVPSIDEEGVLTSVTRIGRITRLDEDHFALENVLLTSFDPQKTDPATAKPEATVVKVSKGLYISSEKKLTSDRQVHINKPGLEIIGESLIYWSVEGLLVLKGPSETLLTGLEAPLPAPDPDGTAAPDTPEGVESTPDRPTDPEAPSQSRPQ